MTDRERSIAEICRELGDLPASKRYHYVHTAVILKTTGVELFRATEQTTDA